MKKLLLSILSLTAVSVAFAQNANIQFINNSPDSSYVALDVYVNNVLKYDNLQFRNATSYLSIPGSVQVTVAFAPDNSTSILDTFYATTATYVPGGNYIMVANGMENIARHTPATTFRTRTYSNARTSATSGPTNTDIVFANGSPDAGTVDIRSGINLINDALQFNNFSSSYLSYPSTTNTKVRVTNDDGNEVYGTYDLTLIPFTGQSGVVLTSGFVDPASNRMGANFELLFVTSAGNVFQLNSGASEDICRIQFLHNSADAKLASVDVYVDDSLAINNMLFRTGTAYLDAYANMNMKIGIAPANSTSVLDTFFSKEVTFDAGKTYVGVINGIESATGYTPAPALDFDLYSQAKEVATNPNKVEMLIAQGSTDAPTFDLVSLIGATLVNDLSYGNFSNGYIALDPMVQFIDMTDATGTTTLRRFNAMLTGLNGLAGTVLASGFMNPANNSNGAPFGLFAATPDGGPFVLIPEIPVSVNDVNRTSLVRVFPNPSADRIFIDGSFSKDAHASILDMTGKEVKSISNLQQVVNVSELNTGIYLICVQDNGKIYTQKFNKQ